MGITPRMLWDFTDWNEQFNHGTFYSESGLSLSDSCDQDNVAQSRWFSEVESLNLEPIAFDEWMDASSNKQHTNTHRDDQEERQGDGQHQVTKGNMTLFMFVVVVISVAVLLAMRRSAAQKEYTQLPY